MAYVTKDGKLTGINAHPGNYGNLRGLGDSGDDEVENEDATGMGVGAGMPYGLGAFLAMKESVASGRRPVLPTMVPSFASERNVYPDRGVPVGRRTFNPAVRRLKGGV